MVTARLDDRETSRGHETWRSLHFDRNGNLAEEKHYGGDREVGGVPSVIVRYDDHGSLSQIEERYFLGEDTYRRICGERNTHRCGTHKKVMSYDRQGPKTEELEFYRDDSLFSKWIALYDSQGNRTQETRYYDDGSEAIFLYVPSSDQESIRITMYRAERRNQFKLEFYGEIVRQFDQRGRLLSEDKRSGVFDSSRKYRYDQNGYSLGYEELKFAGGKLEQIWGSRDMETLFKTKRVYDSSGRETEHVSYTNGSATKTSYRFDENGHLIEMTACDSSSRCRTTLAAKYDADGLPVETILDLPREGRIRITHSYEFDSYHNWTKHVQDFEPEAPDKSSKKHAITVERTIIYY
jgi:YD repeat-containing protein